MRYELLTIVLPKVRSIYGEKFAESFYVNLVKRIRFAKINDVSTCIITKEEDNSVIENLSEDNYLKAISKIIWESDNPTYFDFPNTEYQTSIKSKELIGQYLGDNLEFLKDRLGVNTIALEADSMLSDFDKNLIAKIRYSGFNVRVTLNIGEPNIDTGNYENDEYIQSYAIYKPEAFLDKVSEMDVHQITIRKASRKPCEPRFITDISNILSREAEFLYYLSHGSPVYSYKGKSISVDYDKFANKKDLAKYLVLKNEKLYCRWNDDGSLIF